MPTVRSFKNLEIWKLAASLDQKVFALTKKELLSKDYALKDQMRRASGSIMDNIAEGFGRGGRLEFANFLTIARGSASELQSQILRCKIRDYINGLVCSELEKVVIELGNKIGALIRYLNETLVGGPKYMNRTKSNNRLADDEENYYLSSSCDIAIVENIYND